MIQNVSITFWHLHFSFACINYQIKLVVIREIFPKPHSQDLTGSLKTRFFYWFIIIIFVLADVSGKHYEMSSFPETRLERFVSKRWSKVFIKYPFWTILQKAGDRYDRSLFFISLLFLYFKFQPKDEYWFPKSFFVRQFRVAALRLRRGAHREPSWIISPFTGKTFLPPKDCFRCYRLLQLC